MKTSARIRCGLVTVIAFAALQHAAARVVGRLHVNGPVTNATAKIEVTGGPIIYVDPVQLTATTADADFILITHNHGDHQSIADINRVRKASTVIYSSPPGVPTLMTNFPGVTINAVTPGQKFTIGGVEVETVPMYNVVRNNHPRAMNFVGYVMNIGGVRVYAAGDTERFPEMKTFSTDVALLPLGQTFTMLSVQDAADAAVDVRARIAIPYHYGRGEGTIADATTFASLLNNRMQVLLNTGTEGFPLEISETVAVTEHPASQTIAPGTNATLGVQATGSGAVRYQWRRNGATIVGATNATLPVTAAAPANAGDYEVILSDANGPLVSRMARLAVENPQPGRIVNLSVRGTARGLQPVIVGFVVTGGTKQLLVRGAGPALTGFGVTNAIPAPRLQVMSADGRQILENNNNWRAGGLDTMRAAFTAVGAFGFSDTSADAAVITTADGPRTVWVYDVGERTGVALAEVYDMQPGGTARLVNISARNFVGTNENALIAGFVISGNVPKRLLIRGVGPRLATGFGALADPKVDLFFSGVAGSAPFAANDNWAAETGTAPARAAFTSVGAFDLPDSASRDAALVVTAPAGAYTAQVSGVGNTTGEAMIEVYELP